MKDRRFDIADENYSRSKLHALQLEKSKVTQVNPTVLAEGVTSKSCTTLCFLLARMADSGRWVKGRRKWNVEMRQGGLVLAMGAGGGGLQSVRD